MTDTNNNPLIKYYRVPKFTVRLPSQGAFYKQNEVDLNDDNEVHIMAMTAQDEMTLKNPDALLSGDAIVSLIRSCVPAVQNPRRLLSCDVDALMVGIRAASYGDDSSVNVTCPDCEHENSYSIMYSSLLEVTDPLEPEYEVILDNGVTVYVQPTTFESTVKQQKALFEGSKIQRVLRDDVMSDEAKLKLFSTAFEKASKLNFELVLDAIVKVVATNEEGHPQEVTNKKHISEFVRNISNKEVSKIEEKITQTSTHGIKKEFDTVCAQCGYEWKTPLEFNETNFS